MSVAAGNDSSFFSERVVAVYISFLVAGGYVGLPLIVLTFIFSKKISRSPTTVNVCVTWILFAVSFTLLTFSGQRTNPPPALCLVSSCLTHSASVMCVVSSFTVVLHAWGTLQLWNDMSANRPLVIACLIAPPYIFFVIFFIATAVFGVKNPDLVVTKNGLYCTLSRGILTDVVTPGFCSILICLAVISATAIMIRYYRDSERTKKAFPQASRESSAGLYLRLVLFTLFSLLVLGACIYIFTRSSDFPAIICATLPFAAFIIFGTHKDILTAWGLLKEEDTDSQILPRLPEVAYPDRASVLT